MLETGALQLFSVVHTFWETSQWTWWWFFFTPWRKQLCHRTKRANRNDRDKEAYLSTRNRFLGCL